MLELLRLGSTAARLAPNGEGDILLSVTSSVRPRATRHQGYNVATHRAGAWPDDLPDFLGHGIGPFGRSNRDRADHLELASWTKFRSRGHVCWGDFHDLKLAGFWFGGSNQHANLANGRAASNGNQKKK